MKNRLAPAPNPRVITREVIADYSIRSARAIRGRYAKRAAVESTAALIFDFIVGAMPPVSLALH